jgi:hypothetical protein
MERWDSKTLHLCTGAEVTIVAEEAYINVPLLYELAFCVRDPDGYSYYYTIFDMVPQN